MPIEIKYFRSKWKEDRWSVWLEGLRRMTIKIHGVCVSSITTVAVLLAVQTPFLTKKWKAQVYAVWATLMRVTISSSWDKIPIETGRYRSNIIAALSPSTRFTFSCISLLEVVAKWNQYDLRAKWCGLLDFIRPALVRRWDLFRFNF